LRQKKRVDRKRASLNLVGMVRMVVTRVMVMMVMVMARCKSRHRHQDHRDEQQR
jgi:fumarate reductase subunit D